MRTLALAFALTLLAACGFEPVHGKRSAQTTYAGLEAIEVTIADNSRLAQLLKAEIEDQLNPDYITVPKRYILQISLTETLAGAFINPDGTSSRNDVTLKSAYRLSPIQPAPGQEAAHTGAISRISSYNVSERADYATYVAEQDARKRGILELARAYKLRMAGLMAEIEE